ncbi:uncharacterized protein LOC113748379 [Larimichthys crocea]|uniref:uncharacterized protein LOC113748379 n=1 Tax=Larimichthys crocea TaxID=215358 RepID=UPI000F5DA379|nr:uncharacterized protein LOC113748379 [Larimichthys crocea]XP_027147734.1 uncharacterized protein LOC113748379 [Larimichthys crocea]
MKARPEDLRPPCFLSSGSRPQPPSQGKTTSMHTLAAPETQTLEGFYHFIPDRRRNVVHNESSIAGRRSAAVVVPCLPLPTSTINPTPPRQNTRHPDCGGQQSKLNTVPASPPDPRPAPEEKDEVQEKEPQPAAASITESESDWKLHLEQAGPELSPLPASSVSHGSLSDLSRPPSSLFSRSTDLASGRSSILSDIMNSEDPEGGACSSPLQPRPVMQSPLASPPEGSIPGRSATSSTTNSRPFYEPVFGPTKPLSPRPMSGVLPQSDKPLSIGRESTDASLDPALNPSLDLLTVAFPSATWSSCPSPEETTPRSGSGLKLTPSASLTRLESHHWPVLPPISPVRGRCGTAASRYSELSCSQSRVFDELEAIAPRSASCPSLDEPSDSSGCPSPETDLSPGLAALTLGCDSGNLGSLSRVQLLLLDRLEPETLLSPFSLEEEMSMGQDWSDLRMQYDPGSTSAGVLRPLTAGSISERCDTAGKVQENKSDQSEGGSGSPSSWIIDLTPSHDMFRSACSPCKSDHGSDEGESNYPGRRDHVESSAGGRRPESVDHGAEEEDRRMEERKTKVLSILSKLQDDAPRQPNSNKGRSNFEDFDFLAKYCIFSQEKLAEYKRAFEAEDSDGDGYISCLQVLLALKNIIPPELLSDEEEIYVYRILEMVDFRVTDGLVDLRLFAVISSLAQKIATMDEFMRSLIRDMDFRSLEVRLFKAKQLFLFLLEEQREDTGVTQQGFISAEQLLLELKAGGIHLDQEAAVRRELQNIPPLDLLDFLAYLPLFMLIHKSVISNPLDDSSNL